MNETPRILVFDVNETLSDMAPMGEYFAEVGAPAHLAGLWFAALLRDGFAITAAGGNAAFAEVGAAGLRGLLSGAGIDMDLDRAVDHVLAGLAGLGVHSDVPDGVRTLRSRGFRLVTLTNGSTQATEKVVASAGIRDHFEKLLSVADAAGWKPARAAYHYAAEACRVEPQQMLLVAVHPWDIHGAAAAGLATAWVNRTGSAYPEHFTAPDYTVTSLAELPDVLGAPGTRQE